MNCRWILNRLSNLKFCFKIVDVPKVLFLLITLSPYSNAYAVINHPTSLVLSRIESTPVTYPLRFAFIGDSRMPFGYGPNADSIFAIARQQLDSLHPLFVIHGGDFVQIGTSAQYSHFVAQIDSFSVNVLTVRGNHEIYADEGPFEYDSIFGPTDYSFDYGIYRFIILADCQQDSTLNYYGTHNIDYLVSTDQLNWLDSLLQDAQNRGMISFIFAHVPPYQPGHDTTYCLGYSYYYPRPNYQMSHTQEFTDMLARRHVPVAFFSHHHFYDRHEYNGVLYIISGGGGAPLYSPPLSSPPYGCSCYHFLLFELDSTGVMHAYFYHIGESTPDNYFSFNLDLTSVGEYSSSYDNSVSRRFYIVLRNGQVYDYSKELVLYSIDGRKVGNLMKGERVFLSSGIYVGVNKSHSWTKVIVVK